MSGPGRKTVNARTTPFLEYDLEGPVQPEISRLPLSFDRETQQGPDPRGRRAVDNRAVGLWTWRELSRRASRKVFARTGFTLGDPVLAQ
jgi:hypothetical protein